MCFMKKKIITITGVEGSGKSSASKLVAKQLGYKHFSTGNFMRSLAEEKGMRFDEFHELATQNDEIDKLIDSKSKKIGEEETEVVIDSRLAFNFIPESFKVFLSLDPDTAAQRIFNDMKVNKKRAVEKEATVEAVKESIAERVKNNLERYRRTYGIDYRDTSKFDLVVDTKINNLEEVTEIITKKYQLWLKE